MLGHPIRSTSLPLELSQPIIDGLTVKAMIQVSHRSTLSRRPERPMLGNEDASPNRRAQAAQSDSKLKDGDRRPRINGFAKWFSFGGDVLAVNDPDEQQKRLRYNDLIASAVILQNTADMMQALCDMEKEGIKVDVDDISFLSPYLTSNIKRFGDYELNLERIPEAWIRDSLFATPPTPFGNRAMPNTQTPYGLVDTEALRCLSR